MLWFMYGVQSAAQNHEPHDLSSHNPLLLHRKRRNRGALVLLARGRDKRCSIHFVRGQPRLSWLPPVAAFPVAMMQRPVQGPLPGS